MPVRSSSNSSSSQSGARRDAIVAYLRQRGGRIESPSGVGLTAAIADAVGYGDVGVLNGMLARLEQEGIIERDIRGRRTFAISLASGGGQRGRAAAAAPARATATKAAPRGRAAGRSAGRDNGLAQAAGALVDQLTSLRAQIDELSQRVASLEGSGGATAAAPAKKAGGRKAAAKKAGAAKKTTAKKAGAAKKTTAKKATAKKTAAAKKTGAAKKASAAKKSTTKRTTKKAAAAPRKTAAKRGPAKKAAGKRAPAKRAAVKKSVASGDERSAIRAWARSQGMTINDRGRVPQNVISAYRSAHSR